jgi:hypothetical protein
MKFITNPGFINVVCLLKFFDNALADVAEWSDVVEENLYFYWHRSSSFNFSVCLSMQSGEIRDMAFRHLDCSFAGLCGLCLHLRKRNRAFRDSWQALSG